MNDTPQSIKDLQLKIWLSKSPGDRLKQFMEDNASLFLFWQMAQNSNNKMPASRPDTQSLGVSQ